MPSTGHTSCRVWDTLSTTGNVNWDSRQRTQLRKFFIAQTTISTFSSTLKSYLLTCLSVRKWTLVKPWSLMSPIHQSARLSFPLNSPDLAQERLLPFNHKELWEAQAEKFLALQQKKKSKRDHLSRLIKFESATTVRILQIVLMKMSKRTSLIISLLRDRKEILSRKVLSWHLLLKLFLQRLSALHHQLSPKRRNEKSLTHLGITFDCNNSFFSHKHKSLFSICMSKTKKTSAAGFEPARGNPMRFQVSLLNHSDKLTFMSLWACLPLLSYSFLFFHLLYL